LKIKNAQEFDLVN